ncbi:hypothetical protein HF521_014367 [Silurus meridionalis]|uniref:Metalloendopeptidase n=1 Tax=Silurus meridionalis TaxID=175797 RepID=A0A8T0AAN1_SILME|nr:hypothetical protein HF521_014367 [Silurus meridionalis]
MMSRASLSILALLLGFSQALYLTQPEQEDFTSKILDVNHDVMPDVGRIGGTQMVFLNTVGGAEHELNHALRFHREHARSDRDGYIAINWENIDPTTKSNFDL